MGKFFSIIIGAIVTFVGLVLLIAWWSDFLYLLRAAIPAILIFGGVIALIAGISEFKDTLKEKKGKKE